MIEAELFDDDEGEIVDDRSNQQLWQRLKNDVEQDPSLEGASPAQLQIFFKQWVNARGAQLSEYSRYRFFIIMDHEAIQNLCSVSLPLPKPDWPKYSVKVFDAEFHASRTRLRDPEMHHPKLVARQSKDEGWFWVGGYMLGFLFFHDRVNENEVVRTWDEQDRPIHHATHY